MRCGSRTPTQNLLKAEVARRESRRKTEYRFFVLSGVGGASVNSRTIFAQAPGRVSYYPPQISSPHLRRARSTKGPKSVSSENNWFERGSRRHETSVVLGGPRR